MEELDSVGLLWLSVPVLGSISELCDVASLYVPHQNLAVCFTTQAFFAWRVWILSKNKRIVGIIMVVGGIIQCSTSCFFLLSGTCFNL